jgi:GR25 family glycosyltransferase involved in LPS biosynthesis
MSDVKAFILHLDRAVQRQPQVERLRAALPCPSEIVAATDGARLTQQEVDAVYVRQLHRPRFSFALNRAEIGVFLSHRAAWRRIVAQNLDYALVFEDDAEIDREAFAAACAFARKTRAQWDYALAPAPQTRISGAVLAQANGVALIRPKTPPLRAIAQFVSRESALRLLAATERFDRPIDTFLQMSWVTGVELLAFQPSGVRDASGALGGSTIQRKSLGFGEKLRHEIARPIYRAQVSAWHAFARRPDKT